MVLLHGSTAWRLTRSLDKNLDGAYTKMLRVVKNVPGGSALQMRSFMQDYPGSRPQLERGTLGSAVNAGGVKMKLLVIFFLWEPHGKRSVRGHARTCVDVLEADTEVSRDCLPAAMDDRVGGSTDVNLVVVVCMYCLLLGCLKSQQHIECISETDLFWHFTCFYTEIEAEDQTCFSPVTAYWQWTSQSLHWP